MVGGFRRRVVLSLFLLQQQIIPTYLLAYAV